MTNDCKYKLENDQLCEALKVTSSMEFKAQLELLSHQHKNKLQTQVLYILYMTVPHYEEFAVMFVKMMKRDIDMSMMWGLLYLVVKVAMFHLLIYRLDEYLSKRTQSCPWNRGILWTESSNY